ncbi:transposable element gene, partial [Prunus dulcis]
QFKAFGENQSGHNLKVLRTDRGGEFTSNEFSEYCKSNGIKRELTARYTPQQNGVAERRNRTIVEMARSMLKAKSLPNTFWAEEIHTAVFILNRSPTKAVKDKTPFEAWHRFKPKVDFFKIFGALHMHISLLKREKNLMRKSKAYRLIDPRTKRTRFITFRRTQFLQSPIPSARTADPSSPDSTPRLNARTRSLADIYESCDLALSALEPQKFEEAVKENIWQDAMDEEIRVIKKNRTWELVDRPKSKDIIGLKWVYKTKFNEDGSIQKHKARLVAKGYSQQPGIDFNETFAPVVRMETIRTVLALAAQLKTKVYQLDVKSAFLNGELEEEVYVEQPQGYVEKGREDKVYRLRKALYGLKQAPRGRPLEQGRPWGGASGATAQGPRFLRAPRKKISL